MKVPGSNPGSGSKVLFYKGNSRKERIWWTTYFGYLAGSKRSSHCRFRHMEIQTLLEEFCEYSFAIRGHSKNTTHRYKCNMRSFCSFAGVTRLEQITPSVVRNFLYTGRTQRDWSVHTFLAYQTTLKVFFRWCRSLGYSKNDPAADIEKPKIPQTLPKGIAMRDAMRLLEIVYNYPYDYSFLRYRNHAIFSTFIFAGLRKSELLSLRLTDIDLENGTIFIRKGKGGKDRMVPICSALTQTLKRYLVERKRLNKTCPELFASLNKNSGYTDSGLKRLVVKMSSATGITFSLHGLRHTFATLMIEGGCDIYSLSKMMGHSDIKTTTIYLSASSEHLRTQITKHPLNQCYPSK